MDDCQERIVIIVIIILAIILAIALITSLVLLRSQRWRNRLLYIYSKESTPLLIDGLQSVSGTQLQSPSSNLNNTSYSTNTANTFNSGGENIIYRIGDETPVEQANDLPTGNVQRNANSGLLRVTDYSGNLLASDYSSGINKSSVNVRATPSLLGTYSDSNNYPTYYPPSLTRGAETNNYNVTINNMGDRPRSIIYGGYARDFSTTNSIVSGLDASPSLTVSNLVMPKADLYSHRLAIANGSGCSKDDYLIYQSASQATPSCCCSGQPLNCSCQDGRTRGSAGVIGRQASANSTATNQRQLLNVDWNDAIVYNGTAATLNGVEQICPRCNNYNNNLDCNAYAGNICCQCNNSGIYGALSLPVSSTEVSDKSVMLIMMNNN